MKRLIIASLASLVLACSSQETSCRELETQLESIQNKFCVNMGEFLGDYGCEGNEEKYADLMARYDKLRNTYNKECKPLSIRYNPLGAR